MKVGKPKSKRVPVRLRHKIQKSSAAKQRKTRKEAKKNPEWKSRMKKDPGIPNLFPYKDKILAEVEEGRRRKEEEMQKRRELAKAQRSGAVVAQKAAASAAADDEEILEDADDDEVDDDEDEEMDDDSSNPMAALLASAQARANSYRGPNEDVEDSEDDSGDDADAEEWGGIETTTKEKKTSQPARKALPKQALADPIKAVSALLERLEKTQDGIQQVLDYYQIPPLVTAGSDTTSRFLVDVARKRGRLGRGGIPNLHAAALTVLGDVNDERLRLPAIETKPAASTAASAKGDVQIVSKMAEPFRIAGLFE